MGAGKAAAEQASEQQGLPGQTEEKVSAERRPPLHARGWDQASWLSKLLFSTVNPIIEHAGKGEVLEDDVAWLQPDSDKAECLAAEFEAEYQRSAARLRRKEVGREGGGLGGRSGGFLLLLSSMEGVGQGRLTRLCMLGSSNAL
jgi:hypothetical protein